MAREKQTDLEVSFLELLHAARNVRASTKAAFPHWTLRDVVVVTLDDIRQERADDEGYDADYEIWPDDSQFGVGA